ncbi:MULTISPECIES: hypothetical protein [unclassified Oceanispirochaeta]|uniref:hypothetical protein n=1 Tax=unclassified Oceanispirochaeta TaxID=2635722 RepID=UPI000E090F12|nr:MULTISPECIES: hypothetical protein [unclassified Oceanispirochaeta]MBF9017182.1 hypothetical protein [Oceanispirochaeta sp. M2]MBF9017185.1 hypothetical protein [Oceanispirochaeta sp. M2]NPD73631.1 hypothetical protein [Oceanispirochaeta sp. M1]NPD73634.1 hypothetical protein [Oceanispirochaeta sp. M1]RDG30560.1 hypothetical protein DV872_16180 [Oceanispirochaeta sp. M1]
MIHKLDSIDHEKIDFSKQDIALIYNEKLPSLLADDFEKHLQDSELDILIYKQQEKGPYAGIEWLMPSLISVIILQPYLKSFFSEMGKDHYYLLKNGINSLGKKIIGKNKIVNIQTYTGTDSPKKVRKKYSNHFSILYEVQPKVHFKFIFPSEINFKDFQIANEVISKYIESCLMNETRVLDVIKQNGNIMYSGKLIMTYDFKKKEVIVLNPFSKEDEDC